MAYYINNKIINHTFPPYTVVQITTLIQTCVHVTLTLGVTADFNG